MLQLVALLVMSNEPSAYARLPREGKRDLEVRATWPSRGTNLPLIVFSHGFRGSMDTYDPLVQHWAEHGFVVLQPCHADSLRYLQIGQRRNALQGGPGAFGNWSERPGEVSMVIDRLSEIEGQIPALKGKIDRSRIGVGGHSFGAHTSQLIAGAKTRLGQSFKDERAKAVLLISPQGRGNSFNNESWKGVTGPLMVITGSKDESITDVTPEERKEPFYLAPPGNKYLLWIEGAHHGFGGITGHNFPTGGPRNVDQVALVKQVTLDFFRAFVSKDPRGLRNLNPKEIAEFPGVQAELTTR